MRFIEHRIRVIVAGMLSNAVSDVAVRLLASQPHFKQQACTGFVRCVRATRP